MFYSISLLSEPRRYACQCTLELKCIDRGEVGADDGGRIRVSVRVRRFRDAGGGGGGGGEKKSE